MVKFSTDTSKLDIVRSHLVEILCIHRNSSSFFVVWEFGTGTKRENPESVNSETVFPEIP